MRSYLKPLCAALAAVFALSSCGDKSTLSRIDGDSSEAVTSVTTAAEKVTTTTTKTTKATTTTAKKKKTDELQMLPEGCYDIQPIITAYRTGNTDPLNPTQSEILDAAVEFIESCTNSEMSDYEKELAVHDKMVLEISYDSQELSVFGNSARSSATPYGPLVERKAICTGYAVTFNLLMELMGIKCITVEGENRHSAEHMWNKVRLSGKWYNVDVTWDDNNFDDGSFFLKHKYFNADDDFFEECDHVWERDDYPASTDDKYYYPKYTMNKNPVYVINMEGFKSLFEDSLNAQTGEMVFIPDMSFLNIYDPYFETDGELDEIKEFFVENNAYFLETDTVQTDYGLAVNVLFRTIKEEEKPKEESSSEEESSKEGSSSEAASSKKPEETSAAASSSEAPEVPVSESEADTSSQPAESDDTSSVADTSSEESSKQ